MSLFTPEELRLLALSDRAETDTPIVKAGRMKQVGRYSNKRIRLAGKRHSPLAGWCSTHSAGAGARGLRA